MINLFLKAFLALATLAVAGATMVGGTASASTRVVAAGENLIQNGGFEMPSCDASSCEYGAGSTAIPGWTVGGNSVDIVPSGYFQAFKGNQSLDLSGSASGTVTQDVSTVSGRKYTLKWHLAGNPYCGQATKTMDVYWDGTLAGSFDFDTTGHSPSSMGWVGRHLTVTAAGTTSSVEFSDATPDDSACGATLDAVKLKLDS